jgi:hypothetical protein
MTFRPHEEPPSRTDGGTGSWTTTRMLGVDPQERWKICSVYPKALYIHVQYCSAIIPALAEDSEKGYAYVEVGPIPGEKGYGEGKRDITYFKSAKQTAQELIDDDGYRIRGVFVPEGEEPTPQEIAAAVARRNEWWMKKMIPDGDSVYAQRRDAALVDGNAKLAAQWLGIKREWASMPTVGSYCPACREPIATGAGKCKHCGEYLVWDEDNIPTWKKKSSIAADQRRFFGDKTIADKKNEQAETPGE